MQNRLISLTIIVLLATALVAVTVFLVVQYNVTPGEAQTSKKQVDNLLEVTSEPLSVTTNLADDTYINIEVIFEVDNPDAKKELDKRMFQIKDALIALLQNRSQKDVNGEKGLSQLKADLQQRANGYLSGGSIKQIYVTERVTQ